MQSDLDLMVAVKRGDRAAFYKLVRRHQVSVYNFFLMLTSDEHLSREFTSATFVRVLSERDALHARVRFSTFLYRTSCNVWMEYLHRLGMRPLALPFTPEEARQQIVRTVSSPPRRDAEGLLGCLSNELKLLIVLREFNSLSYEEIADVLEISQQAVRRRIADAFRYLRAAIPPPAQLPMPETPAQSAGPEAKPD